MEKIKITACAKINLSLSVLGKREDGYHELDTVMQSVDLSDTVYIEKCRGIITDCKGISAEENIPNLSMAEAQDSITPEAPLMHKAVTAHMHAVSTAFLNTTEPDT